MLHYLVTNTTLNLHRPVHLVSWRERSHSQECNLWMLFESFKQVTTSICSAWERTVNVRVYRCENECLLTGSTTHCYYVLEPDPYGIFEMDTNIDFREGKFSTTISNHNVLANRYQHVCDRPILAWIWKTKVGVKILYNNKKKKNRSWEIKLAGPYYVQYGKIQLQKIYINNMLFFYFNLKCYNFHWLGLHKCHL